MNSQKLRRKNIKEQKTNKKELNNKDMESEKLNGCKWKKENCNNKLNKLINKSTGNNWTNEAIKIIKK